MSRARALRLHAPQVCAALYPIGPAVAARAPASAFNTCAVFKRTPCLWTP
jgi:hypothetical protein